MAFRPLDEQFDPTLRLPIRGKIYVIESPPAETGLWIQDMIGLATQASEGAEISEDDVAGLKLDDDQEKNIYRRAMGETYDQMIADRVPWAYLKLAGMTTLMWIAFNREAAERIWEHAGDPKASTQPQDHRASARSDRPGSRGSSSKKRKKRRPRKAAESSASTSPTSSADTGT